jgi:hypothetical protein
MDRRSYFFKQKVTKTELNYAQNDAEVADRRFASDLGVFGIVSGLVCSQHAPMPNLTIDITGPGWAYDQTGQRIYVGTGQVLDCSLDYLGNSTLPLTPGNTRWISVHAVFDRQMLDPRVDGNGLTVYFHQPEYFELRVVAGAEGIGPARPAKPADAVLLCDIEMTVGMTQILNADIDITRRDNWVFTAADNVSVNSAGWTKILGSPANVQTSLDAVDTALISRSGAGEITQHLLPDGLTRDLGSATKAWGEAHAEFGVLYKSTLAGALAMSAAKAVTKKKVGLFQAMYEGTDFTPTQSSFLGRTIFGYYGGGIAKSIYFEIDDALPDGVSLTAAWITWAEDTTNAGTARMYRRSNLGTLASISNEVTKTTANAWDDEQEITLGAPVIIDKKTYSYLIKVKGSAGGNSVAIGALAVSYTVTDLGVAAGG